MFVSFIGDKIPQYMSEGAAGADMAAAESYHIEPGQVVMVNTGVSMAIPRGYFGMVVPRSSIVHKKDLIMPNSVGIIDNDYRGEIKFPYRNIGNSTAYIKKGERIGQIVFIELAQAILNRVSDLPETERGASGFGSTGIE